MENEAIKKELAELRELTSLANKYNDYVMSRITNLEARLTALKYEFEEFKEEGKK